MKYNDPAHERLVCIEQQATAHYWDTVWADTDFKNLASYSSAFQWIPDTTKKYLPKGTRILEGGCGQGITVHTLSQAGFDVYGVDTALATIHQLKSRAPHLNVSTADINHLPFENDFFDGYWSLGVIEHNYEGYGLALQEMARVIKPGGYLFLTVPAMSALRRWKAKWGVYPAFKPDKGTRDNFYQFILSPLKLKDDLQNLGFTIVSKQFRDGFKGLKDEVPALKPLWSYLKKSQSVFSRAFKAVITHTASPWAGHIVLLVARKEITKN